MHTIQNSFSLCWLHFLYINFYNINKPKKTVVYVCIYISPNCTFKRTVDIYIYLFTLFHWGEKQCTNKICVYRDFMQFYMRYRLKWNWWPNTLPYCLTKVLRVQNNLHKVTLFQSYNTCRWGNWNNSIENNLHAMSEYKLKLWE